MSDPEQPKRGESADSGNTVFPEGVSELQRLEILNRTLTQQVGSVQAQQRSYKRIVEGASPSQALAILDAEFRRYGNPLDTLALLRVVRQPNGEPAQMHVIGALNPPYRRFLGRFFQLGVNRGARAIENEAPVYLPVPTRDCILNVATMPKEAILTPSDEYSVMIHPLVSPESRAEGPIGAILLCRHGLESIDQAQQHQLGSIVGDYQGALGTRIDLIDGKYAKMKNALSFNKGVHVLSQIRAQSTHEDVPFSMAFLDLDEFKPVNDAYGYDHADQILFQFASVLNSAFRPSDSVIQFGGDEFIVGLKGMSPDKVAERLYGIRETVATIPEVLGLECKLPIRFSAGIVSAYRAPRTQSELRQYASQLLTRAKEDGRDRIYISGR